MLYSKNVLLIVLMSFTLYACQSMPKREIEQGLSPEQILLLQQTGFQFVSADDEWGFDLAAKMLFEFDSDKVRQEQRQKVIGLIHELLDVGINNIRLDGHTDDVGEPKYNLELSKRRAQSVAQLATEAGMLEENIEIRGYGDAKPVATNSTAKGRSENRRVVIIVANY